MVVAGFFGLMSSGKGVVSLAFLRWMRSKQYKRIIANCFLNTKDYTQLDTDNLYIKSKTPEYFRDSYLYITELHNIIDARRASSLLNTNFTQFLTQIGKLDCDVIYDSQLFESQIDLRMREFTPIRFLCERYKMVNGKPVDATFDQRILKEQVAIKLIVEISRTEGVIAKNLGFYIPTQDDYDFYNTREIITLDRERFQSKR